MRTDSFDVLVVGSGHGGTHAALALRRRGFRGSICLVTAEDEPPYQRPPLSKSYLAGRIDQQRLLLRPPGFWSARNVQFITALVDAVDPRGHAVRTADGTGIGFGVLVWSAGSRARQVDCPRGGLRGVHTLRSRADADAVAEDLAAASHVLVVGGGYIGLEAAATVSGLGRQVTLVEPMPSLLSSPCAEPISRYLEDQHRRHGVDIRLGTTVAALTGSCTTGHVTSATLSDGTRVPAQLVIVCLGASPLVEPLRAACAPGRDGVDVDRDGRAGLPDIFAIGDCAAQPRPCAAGQRVRIESVQNAVDQAEAVAAVLTGQPAAQQPPPAFWSDQYDLKLRTVGLSHGYDDYVLRGDPATRSFSLVYLRRGRVIAIDSINATRDFAQGRDLIASAATVEREQLADPDSPLRDLIHPRG